MKQLLRGIFALVLAGSGCSYQDFGNPVMGSIGDAVDSGTPYVDRNVSQTALEKSQKLAKALAQWKKNNTTESSEYHIGPDDVLNVEVLSLEEPGKVSRLLRTVNRDGSIMLTFGGPIKAAGLTVPQLQERVRQALEGRVIKNPQISVGVEQYRSAAVVMTGAVTKPGIYYLNRDSRSLLELLAEADGLSGHAGDELLIVRGSAASSTDSPPDAGTGSPEAVQTNLVVVDLKQLVDEGDVSLNVWVRGGDILTIQQRARQFIYVLGYVYRPGSYELEGGKPVDAVRAVALAGGLTSSARAENSFVLRKSTVGQRMIPVDLTKTVRGTKPPVFMEQGDTLVVGSSFLAKLSEFVKPTIGAGASFAPK